jgi:alpha-1,2-mannosyltransferase
MATFPLGGLAPVRVRLPAAVTESPIVRVIEQDRRWLLPIALSVYVIGTTWTWEFPNWQGVPFPPVWFASALATMAVWRRLGRRFGPIEVAAILAVTAMLTTGVTLFWTQSLRDLTLYLKAGDAWAAGAPVYAQVPLVRPPDDLSNYPFLYPPVTLPLFGALAALPYPVAAGAWMVTSLAAVLGALRWIGLGWRWCLLFLFWPPVMQGLYVGNVAVPMFALFAAAVWRPGLLVVPPLFKLYSGIAALSLLRREHWTHLVVGGAVVLGAGLVTLPLVGIGLWGDWIEALQTYQVSQRLLPNNLYGFGLARHLPLVVLAILALVVTVLALRARDRHEQLSRLGVATVVGSPSLFSHGWLVAVPGIVALDAPWFWLAFGLTACAPGIAWFLVLLVIGASWFVPGLRKRPGDDAWHPLGAAVVPWPTARGTSAQRPEATPADTRIPTPTPSS